MSHLHIHVVIMHICRYKHGDKSERKVVRVDFVVLHIDAEFQAD